VIIFFAILTMLGTAWRDHKDLDANQSITYQWTPKANAPLTVNVEADGGDIDCYLLCRNSDGQGWVIWQLDERPGNHCDFIIDKAAAQPLRLWIHNQGTETAYTHVFVR